MKNFKNKRVFLGVETKAPWPEKFPKGKFLAEQDRHITLAFLGEVDAELLQTLLPSFPSPSFKIGLCGLFSRCLFFPKQKPRLVAFDTEWLDDPAPFFAYQAEVSNWLKGNGFAPDERHPFTPHVTICRFPKSIKEWEQAFSPLPFFLGDIHLYESLGNSCYKPLWTQNIIPPFTELEHTADIAFAIRGENLLSLFVHAEIALAFAFPPIHKYFLSEEAITTVEEIVIKLNEIVSLADQEVGVPFKAVSFHGKTYEENGILTWEMIIDV